jgi:hypothetical protein
MTYRFSAPSRLVLLAASAALTASAAAPAAFTDAFTQGKFSLTARLRYESVEQSALRDAAALTLRTRLGFTTAPWQGLNAMVEAEHIIAADGDSYSQAGLNPAATGRAAVADPETAEFNQIFLAYTGGKTTASLGRQRLVLDNARFIGDVGWRQNMQTFDALVVQDKTIAQTTLTYAYLDQINRVFSARHPQGKWSSDSHVFNAAYTGIAAGTLTGYAYLLDFQNAAPNSCATYGASFTGTAPLAPTVKFSYRAELATQSDYGSSLLNYRATYAALAAGLVGSPGTLTLGYEQLGSDHNVGFKTPLATLHAFNGWADLFLTTPAAGLRETYLRATATLPAAFALTASVHRFATDVAHTRLGDEVDAQLSHKFSPALTGLIKFADFRRDTPAYPDVRKIWVQLEFVY